MANPKAKEGTDINGSSIIDIARPSYGQLQENWPIIKKQVALQLNVINDNFRNICDKVGIDPSKYDPIGLQQKYGGEFQTVYGHGKKYDPNDFKHHIKYKFKATLDNDSPKKDILTNEEKDYYKKIVAGGNNDIIDQIVTYSLINDSNGEHPDVVPSWFMFPGSVFAYHLAVNEFYKAFGKKSLVITFNDKTNYSDLENKYNVNKKRNWHNKKMVFFPNGMPGSLVHERNPAILLYDIEWIGREPEVPRYSPEDRAELWGPLWVENDEQDENLARAVNIANRAKVNTKDETGGWRDEAAEVFTFGGIKADENSKYHLWAQASTFSMWRSGVWGSKSVDNEIHLYDRGSLKVKQSDTPTYIDGSIKFKVRKYDIDFFWGWHWRNDGDGCNLSTNECTVKRRGVVSSTAEMNYINNRHIFEIIKAGPSGTYRVTEETKSDSSPYHNTWGAEWERLTCREDNSLQSTNIQIAQYGGMLNYVILKKLHNTILNVKIDANTTKSNIQALRRDALWNGDFKRQSNFYGKNMVIGRMVRFMLRGNNGNQDAWNGDYYNNVFNNNDNQVNKDGKIGDGVDSYWSPEAAGKWGGGRSAAYINAFAWDGILKSDAHAGIWRTPDEDYARMEITHDHITEEYEFKNMPLFDPVAMALAGQDACFANCTLFDMINGNTKPIKKVNIGDTLHDGAVVTSTIKSKRPPSQDLYDINNVVVTANHSVEHDGDIISAKDHPNARRKPRAHDKTVYCVSTDTKRINQGGTCYTDWDELSNDELVYLNMLSTKNMFSSTDTDSIKKSIHVKFDSAFHPNTSFTLDNGEKCHAKHIKLGNKLKTGETITSIVKVNISDMELFKHTICGKTFYGTSNLVYKNGAEEVSTLYQHDREYKQSYTPHRPLRNGYHFNTDCGHITIHQIQFAHYNRGLEILLPDY
jgi:hypothetical protein